MLVVNTLVLTHIESSMRGEDWLGSEFAHPHSHVGLYSLPGKGFYFFFFLIMLIEITALSSSSVFLSV